MTPRRTFLASGAMLTVFSAAGCRSSALFAGPDPLGTAPPLATDTQVLETVIAAESSLVTLYRSAVTALPAHQGMLGDLLGQHAQHLAQLRAWLIVPSGSTSKPVASPSAPAGPVTLSKLRDAEQQSSLMFLQYLGDVDPALAQLFASIAASDFTHQVLL
jgi:hypothetical protein